MSKSVAVSLLRAALLASAAFGLAGSGAALARVGVTSATDGDPLGKPPQQAERVLRIGIDVQANELIRTGANDRAHLVFLDGTALTVGPNAQLTVDKFVYDPNTKVGELAVSATQGVLRLVGGKISKTNPITISTPSATISIRGGICVLEVQPNNTTSTFLFGNNMSVSASGRTQNVTRPGSQVTTTFGAGPGAPTMAPQGSLGGAIGQLEGSHGAGPNAGSSTAATAAVIVTGTQALAAQPAQSPAAPTPVAYQSPQQWNAATNLASGVTNPAALPSNNVAPTTSSFNLPNVGGATFSGSFIGADSSSGSIGGNLSIGWNFASQTGILNASNNTGSATAPLSLIRNSAVFTGPLTVTNIVRGVTGSGTVLGAFTSTSSVVGVFIGSGNTGSTFAGTFSAKR
jgi:hypothetical protein